MGVERELISTFIVGLSQRLIYFLIKVFTVPDFSKVLLIPLPSGVIVTWQISLQ
jgi:hypothetical protein